MHCFFAICPVGMESLAAEELRELSAHNVQVVHGGVEFSGSFDLLYRVSLRSRCLTRILLRLASFKALSFPELYNKTHKRFWQKYLPVGSEVVVQASCHASRLMHSGRVEQTVAAAILEILQSGSTGAGGAGQQRIYVRFDSDQCTLSLDASGERLDRRGYRQVSGAAPIRETIAAGLLRWMEWKPDEVLMVPMCGTGTVAIEAAMLAMRKPPSLGRSFPFEVWPAASAKRWQATVEKAAGMVKPMPARIHASDLDPKVLESAMANAAVAGIESIKFASCDFRELEPIAEHGLLLLNPPYGSRLGGAGARELYRDIGKQLRGPFAGWRKMVITPDAECERALGMPVERRLAFLHGGMRVQALALR